VETTVVGARLTVLSSDEVETLTNATFELLEGTGVIVREPRAHRLLLSAGAIGTPGEERIRIPQSLLREALSKIPRKWTWYARDPARNIPVGDGGRTRLGPGSSCTNVWDYDSNRVRPPTLQDATDMVRLMDALELVDINFTPVNKETDELPARWHESDALVRDLTNSGKPPVGPSYDGTMARDGLAIAAILAGGEEALRKRPMVAGYCDPVSPLVHDRAMTETLIEYASMGQPVFVTALDLAGASAPATLAGTLLQQNAEVLSGILIAHLVNPRAPVIYGSVSGIMDMKAGTAAVGGPEFSLLSVASVQLAHRFGIPCSVGGQSDSKLPDAQAAIEKATTLFASTMAGADFVDLFFGSFEGFNTTCLEQIVIDHDIAASILRFREGIAMDDAHLGLDLLREVGPGGNFLQNRSALTHTRRWMLTEDYFPVAADRRSRFAWEKGGSPSMLDRAHQRARALLKEHKVLPLEPAMATEMAAVLDRIRRECLPVAS
jgi:trimethylamine---corrinoid protein Co-methyltransferase